MGAVDGNTIGGSAVDLIPFFQHLNTFLTGSTSGAHPDLFYLLLLPKWPQAGFDKWREHFRARAQAKGISDATWTRVMGRVEPDMSVFTEMRNQPEFNEEAAIQEQSEPGSSGGADYRNVGDLWPEDLGGHRTLFALALPLVGLH